MTTRRAVIRTALTLSALAALETMLSACGADTTDGSAPAAPRPTTGGAADPGSAEALEPNVRAMLAAYGIEAARAEDAVTALDQVPEQRPLVVTGSVGYDHVLLADDSEKVAVPLTGGQFYLAVAPYQTQTHDCYYHNLGGCQGELPHTPVQVTVTTDGGETLVEENTTTYANGFVGFWIPRDLTGTVTLTTEDETATSPFDSGPDGPTCLTTLQLA